MIPDGRPTMIGPVDAALIAGRKAIAAKPLLHSRKVPSRDMGSA
jgi:hypothetical protein